MINKISNAAMSKFIQPQKQQNSNKSNISFGATTHTFFNRISHLTGEKTFLEKKLSFQEEKLWLEKLLEQIEKGVFKKDTRLSNGDNYCFKSKGFFNKTTFSFRKTEGIEGFGNLRVIYGNKRVKEVMQTMVDDEMPVINRGIWKTLSIKLMTLAGIQ